MYTSVRRQRPVWWSDTIAVTTAVAVPVPQKDDGWVHKNSRSRSAPERDRMRAAPSDGRREDGRKTSPFGQVTSARHGRRVDHKPMI